MIKFSIQLKDFIVDTKRSDEISELPEDEAISVLTEAYSFMPGSVDIKIEKRIAHVTIHHEPSEPDKAIKLYNRAIKHAEKGRYERAIPLLIFVTKELPTHPDARRNLGMAYLESGDVENAEQHILNALRVDCTDAHAFLLLGNIYAKHKGDFSRAKELYRKAYDLDPENPYLLNNIAAIYTEEGELGLAEEYVERTMRIPKDCPNAYLGLARLRMKQGREQEALEALEALFTDSAPTTIRSQPVFDDARGLYLDLNRTLAEASFDHLMEVVDARASEIEESGGIPIEIVEDSSLEVIAATLQQSWIYDRDKHIVRYQVASRAVSPHLVAHELEHLALAQAAREAGRNRHFATTQRSQEWVIRSMGAERRRLQRMGYSDQAIAGVTMQWVDGLARHLFNIPIDMIIEQRLYEGAVTLRKSQFASLHADHLVALETLNSEDVQKITPAIILRSSMTLSNAYALFKDSLYSGITNYAEVYAKLPYTRQARQLLSAWQDAMASFEPGDEYALVDEFADLLGLRQLYAWQTDESQSAPRESTASSGRQQATTNPELLKEKEKASVMYCLSALKLFEGLSESQVRAIGAEIAIMGQQGIDYASPEQKYGVETIPGGSFSGLHLLCLMYVAFKRVEPDADLGLDLGDAYRQALTLHGS